MMRGKKGGAQWPIIALFFLVAIALLVGNNALVNVTNDIGNTQYDILQKVESAAAINVYIDKAAQLSATQTRDAFIASAGVYQQLTETGEVAPSACGNYLYPSYNSKTNDCTPKYADTIKNYFDDFFFNYLQHHPGDTSLYFLYDLNLAELSSQELSLQAEGEQISLPFTTQTAPLQTTSLTCKDLFLIRKQYPKTALGFYTKEKPITCGSGQCFAEVANLLYETYKTQNKEYAYVTSGESPYCPQDVRTLSGKQTSSSGNSANAVLSPNQIITDNFFADVEISDDRFEQRKELMPGFDSAGWVWWAGKHAGISFFDKREGEATYLNSALQQTTLCEKDACTLTFLLANAEPGDILFFRDEAKLREDGSKALGGGIYLAIYMETDTITGQPVIIHSDTKKGLVKEFLPEKYASGQDTKIAAIFRPTYQSGPLTLPDDIKIIPPFIGPFEWCQNQQANQPTQKYVNQLQTQPFKSSQTTSYYSLAIEKATDSGVDPALLITHAVLESSLGQNNKCTAQQKSALTGCGWPLSCADGCGCQSPAVLSDDAQLECTAKTDLGAYKEALDGIDVVIGKYEECSAYKNNPETFWNCIFCIYQGSYEKVIGSGKLYFTQDHTCEYAERAKGIYCSWREYFDANWDDLSALASLHVSSELSFTPAFSTSTNLDLASMNLITDKTNGFVPSLKTCDNNLENCVQSKINQFNGKYPNDIRITRLQKDNAFANDFVEQVLDCRFNEQRDCVCPITPAYRGFGPSKQQLIFFSDGRMTADGDLIYDFSFNPAIPTENLSLPQSAIILDVEGDPALVEDKATLYVDDTGQGVVTNNQEGWILNTSTTPATTKGKDVMAFGLLKQTYSSMTWLPYEQNITHLTCEDSKHYFSFQAEIYSTGDIINFSVYLDDIQPPEVWPTSTATTGVCFEVPTLNPQLLNPTTIFNNPLGNSQSNQPNPFAGNLDIIGLSNTATLKWEAPTNQEKIHKFIIEISQDSTFNRNVGRREVLVATALELPPAQTEPPMLEQLAAHTGSQQANSVSKYYFKTNSEYPLGGFYQEDINYYYRITPVDHYRNNGTTTQVATFTFTDPYASGLPLTSQEIDLLKAGAQVTTQGVFSLVCLYNPNNLITIDDFLPPTQGNLRVYPGELNPNKTVADRTLYQIESIDNVICDESQPGVGKICAANAELVTTLQQLSPELVQKGWTMTINQAHRSWDIQYELWKQSGFDRSMACNPGDKNNPYLCPHMVAGAIDISILDSSRNHIGSVAQEAFMCEHGFVRYGKERWHFEMGTKKWNKAVDARASGTCCYYGTSAPQDTGGQTCSI